MLQKRFSFWSKWMILHLPFQNRILTQSMSQPSVPKDVFWIKVRSYNLLRGLSCIIICNRLTEQNSVPCRNNLSYNCGLILLVWGF